VVRRTGICSRAADSSLDCFVAAKTDQIGCDARGASRRAAQRRCRQTVLFDGL